MSTTAQPPHRADDQQHRRNLASRIFAVLKDNGSFPRPVYDMRGKSIPKGGMNSLLKQYPFDAVRCEIGGTTLTVEITNQRHGEQDEPDGVRYACYDFEDFRAWFYNMLRKAGMTPVPSAAVVCPRQPQSKTPHPDLRSRPMFHRKQKKGR